MGMPVFGEVVRIVPGYIAQGQPPARADQASSASPMKSLLSSYAGETG
jgi:hypothetical protein